MAKLEQRILLADADVLIDYVTSEKALLRAISDHIAPLNVLEQVLDTVDGLNRSDCKKLHIEVVATTTDELIEAGQSRGALSFEDRLNLHACIRREWICVSNDVLLLKACVQKNVPTKRGLRLLFELAEWTSPEFVDTWMANIELSEGVPWVSQDLPPSSRTKPSAR